MNTQIKCHISGVYPYTGMSLCHQKEQSTIHTTTTMQMNLENTVLVLKDHTVYDSIDMKRPEQAIHTDGKQIVVTRDRGVGLREMGSDC